MSLPCLEAGTLVHRAALQSFTTADDEAGQANKTWATEATYWVRVEPLSGRELEKARTMRADITHRVTCRGAIAVTPEKRWLFKGRELNVAAVIDPEERGVLKQCLCVEKVAGT